MMTTTHTTESTTLPPSMEVAGGIVAERCYTDRKLHQALLNDPIEAINSLLSEHNEKPVNVKTVLPNCKVHTLQNTSNRWHIVLPFEYNGEEPSNENGLLSEEDLEHVAGGFIILSSIATALGVAATGASIVASGSALTATTAWAAGVLASVAGISGVASGVTVLSTGVIAAITAGVIGGSAALTAGAALGAVAGLDATGIIDAW